MKNLSKFKSLIISIMVLGIFFTLGSKSIYANTLDLKSGIYELENDVYHESETGMAMARTYLLPTMAVEVRRDSITYIVGFSGSDYMENYRFTLNGEEIPVEILQYGSKDGVVKLKVEVDKVDANMEAFIYVEPMERDVQFSVIPKMDTLTLVEEIIEETREADMVEYENENNSTAITGEDNESVDAISGVSKKMVKYITGVVIGAVVIVGAIIVIKKKKISKK